MVRLQMACLVVFLVAHAWYFLGTMRAGINGFDLEFYKNALRAATPCLKVSIPCLVGYSGIGIVLFRESAAGSAWRRLAWVSLLAGFLAWAVFLAGYPVWLWRAWNNARAMLDSLGPDSLQPPATLRLLFPPTGE